MSHEEDLALFFDRIASSAEAQAAMLLLGNHNMHHVHKRITGLNTSSLPGMLLIARKFNSSSEKVVLS